MTGEVLLASDCEFVVSKVSAVLESLDQTICLPQDRQRLEPHLEGRRVKAAFIALNCPKEEQSAVSRIRAVSPLLPVYLLRSDVDPAAESTDLHPVDGRISLPIRYGEIIEALRRIELKRLAENTDEERCLPTGESRRMETIRNLIRQVAPTDANVLLSGESGTGKEVAARAIHRLSLRASRPFVAVNCGAIPPELLESELFGHEKGSFTGAFQSRAGRFEMARGGTLFLDEIGDMPMNMQVKLLRVIQEKTFERVGGTRLMQSDVRIIAATHQDLEKLIEAGRFRTDLFYRLHVFPIELPALRERREDIPRLITEFIRYRSPIDQRIAGFDEAALSMLMGHRLPGNVRELQNLVERLGILHPGERITPEQLPARYRASGPESGLMAGLAPFEGAATLSLTDGADRRINLKQYLASLERSLICRALEQSDWVVSQAARTLSVQRTTLIEKIRKLKISPPLHDDNRAAM